MGEMTKNRSTKWPMTIKMTVCHSRNITGGSLIGHLWKDVKAVKVTVKPRWPHAGDKAGAHARHLETGDGCTFPRFLQCFVHPVDNNVIIDLLPSSDFFKDIQRVPGEKSRMICCRNVAKNVHHLKRATGVEKFLFSCRRRWPETMTCEGEKKKMSQSQVLLE